MEGQVVAWGQVGAVEEVEGVSSRMTWRFTVGIVARRRSVLSGPMRVWPVVEVEITEARTVVMR